MSRKKAKGIQEAAATPPEAPPLEDLEFEIDFDDENVKTIIEELTGRTCDYCGGEVRWTDPVELEAQDPESYADLIERAGVDPEEVFLSWECDNCENFSLITRDGEWQWLDEQPECSTCESVEVDVVDPAQVASINRARYLELKKQLGAEVLLSGLSIVCRACGDISWEPAHDGY